MDHSSETPNVARMYDWYLGGHHNFPADQQAARQAAALSPAVVIGAQSSRAFLHRAVRYMTIHHIEQFLDLGSGLPTSSNCGRRA